MCTTLARGALGSVTPKSRIDARCSQRPFARTARACAHSSSAPGKFSASSNSRSDLSRSDSGRGNAAPTYRYACRLGLDRALSLVDHSDTLADHLRNAARAAQMRSREGRVECLRDSDGLFALTRSQYFPGLAKRRSSAGFLRQRARLERLNPCAASTCVRAARIQEEL